jgi:phosphoribosylformylglycinamidine (FGAM) synthase-like enzyme
LVKGVVKGIGDYGNAFGIPIVGGEVFFDDSYNTNPLVNAFSAGILKVGEQISAKASRCWKPSIYSRFSYRKRWYCRSFVCIKRYYRRIG